MSSTTPSDSPAATFSLAQARNIVRDLFEPNEKIYWADFLGSILTGHFCSVLGRLISDNYARPDQRWISWGGQAICLVFACLLYYRAVMFIHEIVHLPEKKFRAFRIAWNVLCGIPFMVPSFTYYPHLDHHRRRTFGTHEDGEYLPLAKMSPWYSILYALQGIVAPPLTFIRFGLLSPLAWISPAFRKFLHQRFSSLVMDPTYIRPLPTESVRRVMWLQEVACFSICLALATLPPLLLNRWPIRFAIQAYLIGLAIITLNSIRTLGAHRWWNEGREVTFVEQMQDSVVIDNDSILSILINPVGLRYHALHHLFPSMPYHNLRTAHKRLLAELPADSPYRATVEHSLLGTIGQLLKRASRRNASVGSKVEGAPSQVESPDQLEAA